MRRRAIIMAVIFSIIGGGLAITGWEFWVPPLAVLGGLGAFLILLRSVALGWSRLLSDLAIAILLPLVITGIAMTIRRTDRYLFANRRAEPIARILDERLRRDGKLPVRIKDIPEVLGYCVSNNIVATEASMGGLTPECYDGSDLVLHSDQYHYSIVVPVTCRSPLSFTRTYIYRRDSESPGWTLMHVVWHMRVM